MFTYPHITKRKDVINMDRCRVLIVDDDRGMRDTLCAILKSLCDVEAVETAEIALDRLDLKLYHVVISDIRLPGIDGLELLKIIKQRWPSTSVIMVSVINDICVAVEAMRLGAFYYTTKEFDWEPLNQLVQLAVQGPYDLRDVKLEWLRNENWKLRQEVQELRARLHDPSVAGKH